jgi:hypothetical protein
MAWRQAPGVNHRISPAESSKPAPARIKSPNAGKQFFQNLQASQQQRINMMSLWHTIPVQWLFGIAVAFDD